MKFQPKKPLSCFVLEEKLEEFLNQDFAALYLMSLFSLSESHRDFSLAYWQSNKGMSSLEDRGYDLENYSNLKLGDV